MILKRWSSTNRILVYCILLNGELLNYVMSNKSVIYLIDHVHVPTRYCLFKLQVQYYSRQHPFWRLPATSNPTVQLVVFIPFSYRNHITPFRLCRTSSQVFFFCPFIFHCALRPLSRQKLAYLTRTPDFSFSKTAAIFCYLITKTKTVTISFQSNSLKCRICAAKLIGKIVNPFAAVCYRNARILLSFVDSLVGCHKSNEFIFIFFFLLSSQMLLAPEQRGEMRIVNLN